MAGETQFGDGKSVFDYIIVGAGSAGCVVARRLIEETDATVLLLEAGESADGITSAEIPSRWVENIGAAHDWNYTYAPSPHTNNRSIFLSRGKIVGGSGSTNAMVWWRGNQADYDRWAEAGNPGWDYNSVLPLFKKSEDWEDGANSVRGSGGPLRIERAKDLHPVATALIDAGFACGMPYLDDINVPRAEGAGPINMNVSNGRRCSTAGAFLRPILNNPRLTILTGSRTVRLRFAGTRCIGLDYLRRGLLHSSRASSEVILCSGAIDTPRLLLLSGIGPEDELRRLGIRPLVNAANVGRNLQDHPIIAGLCFAPSRSLPPPNNNLEGSTLIAKSSSARDVPDLMFVSIQIPYVSPEIQAEHRIPPNAFSIAPGLMGVKSRGYMRMLTSRFDGPLEIQPNFLAESADVEALLLGMELGFELASQSAFRELTERWVVPPRRLSRQDAINFLRQACCSYFHPVGTCAMGPNADDVVDGELRVRGVTGLRIADASIMPQITSGNTQAPTVMIAEFASRLIAHAGGTRLASRSSEIFLQ